MNLFISSVIHGLTSLRLQSSFVGSSVKHPALAICVIASLVGSSTRWFKRETPRVGNIIASLVGSSTSSEIRWFKHMGGLEGRGGVAVLEVVVVLANHFEHVEGQVVEL